MTELEELQEKVARLESQLSSKESHKKELRKEKYREDLQRIVNELETSKNFRNRSELYRAIVGTEWAKNLPRPLTTQVARLWCDKWNIIVKTKLNGQTVCEISKNLGVSVEIVNGALDSMGVKPEEINDMDLSVKIKEYEAKLKHNNDLVLAMRASKLLLQLLLFLLWQYLYFRLVGIF